MSNKKFGEKPNHRKSKVSWALIVNPGLGGPKSLAEGSSRWTDGQYSVPNISFQWNDASSSFMRVLAIRV